MFYPTKFFPCTANNQQATCKVIHMPYITTLVTCSTLNGCTELWLINNWTSTEHHHSIDNYYDVFEQVPSTLF